MPQLTYPGEPAIALEGMLATSEFRHVETGLVNLAAGINFGRGVVLATSASKDQVKLPTGAGDLALGLFRGFTIRDFGRMPTTPHYLDKEPCSVLRRGSIWLVTIDAMASGGEVFITNAGADAGKIQATAAAGAATTVAGVRCKIGAGAGGLAYIEINLPA